MINQCHFLVIILTWLFLLIPLDVKSEVAVIDLSCASCGYKERLIQGSDEVDQAHNVQNIIGIRYPG